MSEIQKAYTDALNGAFEFENVEMEFEKKEIDDIIELSKSISTDTAAEELLNWLIKNVENYIDNYERCFRIDLIIEENSSEEMENLKLLQDLYRAIPNDEDLVEAHQVADLMDLQQVLADGRNSEIPEENLNLGQLFESEAFQKLAECRELLDGITYEIHDKALNSDKLQELYEKMIYFYELAGFSNGEMLLRDLKGNVDIVEFMYESFSMAVNVMEGFVDRETDVQTDKKTIKQYVIPEGFTLLLEIAFSDNTFAMF